MSDLFTAAGIARDEAIETVTVNAGEWMTFAIATIQEMEGAVTGEDVSIYVAEKIGPPHHPNANGALIMSAVRKKILRPTGEYRAMKKRQSHARKTPVYWVAA